MNIESMVVAPNDKKVVRCDSAVVAWHDVFGYA